MAEVTFLTLYSWKDNNHWMFSSEDNTILSVLCTQQQWHCTLLQSCSLFACFLLFCYVLFHCCMQLSLSIVNLWFLLHYRLIFTGIITALLLHHLCIVTSSLLHCHSIVAAMAPVMALFVSGLVKSMWCSNDVLNSCHWSHSRCACFAQHIFVIYERNWRRDIHQFFLRDSPPIVPAHIKHQLHDSA